MTIAWLLLQHLRLKASILTFQILAFLDVFHADSLRVEELQAGFKPRLLKLFTKNI